MPDHSSTITSKVRDTRGHLLRQRRFFLATQEYIADEVLYTLDRENELFKNQTFCGNELVSNTLKFFLTNTAAAGSTASPDPNWWDDPSP